MDTTLVATTEVTFARQILRADCPVLVCFGVRTCPARRALLPILTRIAVAFQGQLRVATVLLDDAPLLAEQYGIVASPTLGVFQHGERQGQVVGFIPEGLVQVLADEVCHGAVSGDTRWSPCEERFETAVIIPLLAQWGFTVQRQVPCVLPSHPTAHRGRIDLLVYEHPSSPPVTLIESKRQIRHAQELRQAVTQAATYAHSLALASFVIAAPRGLWIYRYGDAGAVCERHVTSLALHQTPELPRHLLLQLRAGGAAA
ncbi:hypothetical protein EYB53_001565 [Candidatus Chloroploca sp. M-50]|uniref:Thioredoxin domain-containing protein n=1 Tax=Candidatus Chloroploca mongolica TaxID=2528176 RepID=A0ABS4D4M8_9CHLR|nr:thioredoxin domain-containing protein [Candidatus Chloroploca mongolica]MBP1464384.1 hypothetical protein [Candidatus Chloroploca mongolica]